MIESGARLHHGLKSFFILSDAGGEFPEQR
jgi:hypothetical protein